MKCSFPNCTNNTVGDNEYCIGHNRMLNIVPVEHNTSLKKRGEKMMDQMKLYKPMIKNYLEQPENKVCLILSPVCTVKATCVNHKKRRGKNLLNQKYWEPSCFHCNGYIERHPDWALENGHLISVHQVEKQTV